MADIELLPLPDPEWKAADGVSPGVFSAEQVRGYARANVEHHTAKLRAEGVVKEFRRPSTVYNADKEPEP